jgi:hypothetical protein
VLGDAVVIAHQMSHHKVLRFGFNLTNMLSVREREVRFPDVHLRSDHAHGSEEESEEADVEGRCEAESGEEDEEEVV